MMCAPRISPCGLAEDQLHEAFDFADRARLAARLKGNLPTLNFYALLLRRALGQADARDLRLAIGAARERSSLSSA